MAICKLCQQEMNEAAGCTQTLLVYLGRSFERIHFGRETSFTEIWKIMTGGVPPARCPDCGAAQGGYHHPPCDQEECPICGNQLLSCVHEKAGVA